MTTQEATRLTDALTAGEKRVLIARAKHGSVKAAAIALGIAPETVKSQTRMAFIRLRVKSFTEAALIAQREGLVQ